jgi:hypothetical protein
MARSPLPVWNSDEAVGKEATPKSARISILESRMADSLPNSFLSGTSTPNKSKNFLGACLFKSAHCGGNSNTRSARCWGDGLESHDRWNKTCCQKGPVWNSGTIFSKPTLDRSRR